MGCCSSKKKSEVQIGKVDIVSQWYVSTDERTQYVTLFPRKEGHQYSLIWLHGMGGSAHGPKETFLENPGLVPTSCKVIIPTAPTRRITASPPALQHMKRTSWFDILAMNIDPSLPLEESRQTISQWELRKSV